MKAIINQVADSILAEVANAGTWELTRHDPIWREPKEKPVLAVYGTSTLVSVSDAPPGALRVTGYQGDVHEVVVEYWEAAGDQAQTLTRNATAELAAYDVATNLRRWALAHASGWSGICNKFDCVRVDYHSGVRREAFVRYCRVIYNAHTTEAFS